MRPMQTQPSSIFLMIISFLIGIFLTIIPLPGWVVWLRPQWIFALLLFWVINASSQCGVGVAFILGMLMDLITGTPVGEHALVFIIVTYVALKNYSRIQYLSRWQQAVVVGILTAMNAVLQGLILGFTGHSTHIALYLLSAITTAFIWPWILALNHFRPRAFIR